MPSVPESAEPTTIEECRKCGEKPARGVSWVDQGIYYFRGDCCGRTLWEGVMEEVNREQAEKKLQAEKANTNRERYMREFGEKMQQDYRRVEESMKEDPYKVLQEDAEFMFEKIMPI